MSILVLAYNFSSAQVEPPTSNQIRLNDSLYANVSKIWARNLTTDGVDMRTVLLAVPIGTDLYVQDKNDSATFARYTVNAAPIDKASYVEFSVTAVAHGGSSFINNQAVIAILITADVVAPPPPLGGPDLVAFQTAKDHLRITDSDHDAEIQSKLSQAAAAIVDYLKDRADPAWDASTTPLPVQAATLRLLADFYEFRGDEDPATGAADLTSSTWIKIADLLRRFRDPALA